ncbi:hypothetical protein ACF0H5_014662 [Mactra antiquata]
MHILLVYFFVFLQVLRGLGNLLHQPCFASGNWEAVAENLGYEYEEIKHFCTMASVKQDVTPGELMLQHWVQQPCGRTFFVLYNALNKADRADCIQYLEKEIYDSVICTDLMICIKYEDGRSASHVCLKTRADHSLLESLRNLHLFEQPVQDKYDLLDTNVSWTRSMAKEFKGRQLMLLRRQDNMEQNPTVDSSGIDMDSTDHFSESQRCSNEVIGHTRQYASNIVNQSRSQSVLSDVQQIQSCQVSSINQASGNNSSVLPSGPIVRVGNISGTQVVNVSNIHCDVKTGTTMNSSTGTKQKQVVATSSCTYNNVSDYRTSLVSASSIDIRMRDSAIVGKPDQNDLNIRTKSSAPHSFNVTDASCNLFKNETKYSKDKCKDIEFPFRSDVPACPKMLAKYNNNSSSSSEENQSMSIEDNRVIITVISDERKEHKSSGNHSIDDLDEHDESYVDPSEYLQPAESTTAFGAEIIGMKERQGEIRTQTYPDESSDTDEYKDFNMEEYRPPETLFVQGDDCITIESVGNDRNNDINNVNSDVNDMTASTIDTAAASDLINDNIEVKVNANVEEYMIASYVANSDETSDIVDTIQFEEFSSNDLESSTSEYQYSQWGGHNHDNDHDNEQTLKEVWPSSSEGLGHADEQTFLKEIWPSSNEEFGRAEVSDNSCLESEQFFPLKNDPECDKYSANEMNYRGLANNSIQFVDNSLSANFKSFSFDSLKSYTKRHEIPENVGTTDKYDGNEVVHSKDRAGSLDSGKKSRFYLDFNSFSQTSPDSSHSDPKQNASLHTATSTDRPGKKLNRFVSQYPEETRKKSVYERLQRGQSCPTEFGYGDSIHFLEMPVIADVFSPVTDESKLTEFQDSDDGSVDTIDSVESMETISGKRHTFPVSMQNHNRKRTRLHTQSLRPQEKNVRFDDVESESPVEMSHSPALPARRNLPDIRKSSFQSESFDPTILRGRSVNNGELVPCKIVIAGKSSRPPLDHLLANDKLYEFYKVQLNGYPGWCPRETEHTIEKTMRDALSSDGYYILWYIRERKSLVLSVSFQRSLINYRIHTKVFDNRMNFYISQGHYFQSLHELLRYYHDFGVRVDVGSHQGYFGRHGNRISLKCPVIVQYGRSNPVSV